MLSIAPDPNREERFVRFYMQTGDALDACKRAGFVAHGGYDDREVAQYLIERADIRAAVQAAKDAASRPVEITRESLLTDLEKIHTAAMGDGEYTPAIAAKKMQATLLGLVQENVQVTHRMDVTRMTDAQLIALLEKKTRQAPMIDVTPQPVGIGHIK